MVIILQPQPTANITNMFIQNWAMRLVYFPTISMNINSETQKCVSEGMYIPDPSQI